MSEPNSGKWSIVKNGQPGRPLVSIITIVFNGAVCLEKAIASVLEQTYDNIEYIVLDGGSTDGTLDIIRKYEDRIAYWESGPDAGISDAMNRGIMLSHGELIGFIHSDDWYEKEAVRDAVRSYVDGKPDVIHGDMNYCKQGCLPVALASGQNPERIWITMIYNHPATFVSKTAYDTYGLFDTSYKIAMDYELFLRFHVKGARFRYVNEVLANMTVEGASNRRALEGLRETFRAQRAYGRGIIPAIFWFAIKALSDIIIVYLLGNDRIILQKMRRMWRRTLDIGK